jgi:hypothetical protein
VTADTHAIVPAEAAGALARLELCLMDRLQLVKRAREACAALDWLRRFGDEAVGSAGFRVEITVGFAGSVPGCAQAIGALEKSATELGARILAGAIASAEADIAEAFAPSDEPQ